MSYSCKRQKGTTVTNDFQKLFGESNRKWYNIWVDKCSEFYEKSMKLWLENYVIQMYSIFKNMLLLKDLLES